MMACRLHAQCRWRPRHYLSTLQNDYFGISSMGDARCLPIVADHLTFGIAVDMLLSGCKSNPVITVLTTAIHNQHVVACVQRGF